MKRSENDNSMNEPESSASLSVTAHAKINLNLLVSPLGEDGYHPLDSVVAKISLCDNITLKPAAAGKISCVCKGDIDCGPEEKNLAYRAAEAMSELAGGKGVKITIEKKIPAGGGFGGGSSDAAAVIKGLNELWQLGLDEAKLIGIAAALGSDVPLFIMQGPVRMTGRGEILRPIEIRPFKAVIIMPRIKCPTGEVYQAYDLLASKTYEQLPTNIFTQPISDWVHLLENDLTEPAFAVTPELQGLRDMVKIVTGITPMVTGSGSGMFIICGEKLDADKLTLRIKSELLLRALAVTSV